MADFRYHISCGTLAVLRDGDWRPIGTGYSGAPGAVNRPDRVSVRSVGPIPPGRWYMSRAPWSTKGPQVIALVPDHATQTYGRSAFLIHGDNKRQNRSASRGCVILARHHRDRIARALPATLEVIAGPYVTTP